MAYNACTAGGCAVSPLSPPVETGIVFISQNNELISLCYADVAPAEDEFPIAIIIGVVAAVVIIVVIIIIIVVICYWCKKSKRKQYIM